MRTELRLVEVGGGFAGQRTLIKSTQSSDAPLRWRVFTHLKARLIAEVSATAVQFSGGDRVIGIGATLNERFTLEKELGQGGMGTVYRANDQVLGRNVAIKLLRDAGTEKEAEQIRLEAQILARLVHDRIVRLYDFGETEGNYFLVMEEVNGPSFAH